MKLARKITLLLLITLLIVIVGYFFNVNNDVIDLDFVFHKFVDVKIGTVVVFSFVAGFLFSILFMIFEFISMSGREFKLKRQNKKLRKELARLKKEYEPEEEVADEPKMLPEPKDNETEEQSEEED